MRSTTIYFRVDHGSFLCPPFLRNIHTHTQVGGAHPVIVFVFRREEKNPPDFTCADKRGTVARGGDWYRVLMASVEDGVWYTRTACMCARAKN